MSTARIRRVLPSEANFTGFATWGFESSSILDCISRFSSKCSSAMSFTLLVLFGDAAFSNQISHVINSRMMSILRIVVSRNDLFDTKDWI